MSVSIKASGWRQFFAPVPDAIQHSVPFVDYLSSSDGAWTCFSVVDSVLSYVQLFYPLSASGHALIGRVRKGIATVGGALSVPACLVAGLQVYRQVEKVTYSDEGARWQDTAKKISLKIVDLINNLTYLPELLSQLRWIHFTPVQHCFIDSVYYVSFLVLEGSSFPSLEERRQSWGATAKSVLSVAISLLSLGGVVCGIPLGGAGGFAVTLLHLNSLWLALKISTHFSQARPDTQITSKLG